MSTMAITPAAAAMLAHADTEFDVSLADMQRVGARHELSGVATQFVAEQMISQGWLVQIGDSYALTKEGARAADIVLE